MNDKKLLKMLKSEVDSMTPNILPEIKRHENMDKKHVTIINEKYSKSRRWLTALASCMVVVIAMLCVSVPIIMSHNDNSKNNIQNQNPIIDQDKTADDVDESNK